MRRSPKCPKMFSMAYLLTKKLSPKCCSVMLYPGPSLSRDCSYQHIWRRLGELRRTQ